MRRLTNKLNLPETIVKACQYDTYKVAGDISVTGLIDSPRIRMLKRMNEYSEDVSDMLYALLGTALHHILERANIDNVRKRAFLMVIETFTEEAKKIQATAPEKAEQLKNVAKYLQDIIPVFFPEIGDRYVFELTLRVEIGETTLYGTFDLFDKETGILYDYKFTSVYAYLYPESKKGWVRQTNIYAFLLTKSGYEVKGIKIIAFFRDWSAGSILKNKDYPKTQILEIDVPLETMDKIANWVANRIDLHKQAEDTGVLPLCTGGERWATADQYAFKTPGSTKAIRVFDQEFLRDEFMTNNAHLYKDLYWELRPGVSKRCEHYCPVSEFCTQFADEKKRLLAEATKEK